MQHAAFDLHAATPGIIYTIRALHPLIRLLHVSGTTNASDPCNSSACSLTRSASSNSS